MAEEGRAVCVYGLPANVDHERLRDKLLIHFLRERNGGGEVTSVTIIGRTPQRALITFEESRVAQSVLRHHPHILQLDGIKYELSLSLPCQEPLSLNKVILDMAVTIDCSQLPRGADSLNVLLSEFPGLRMKRGLSQHICTLQGNYSDFQCAFPHMQMLFYHHLSKAEYPNYNGKSSQGPEKREDLASVNKWASFASHSPGLNAGDLSSGSTVGFRQEQYRLQDNNEALTERSTLTKKSKMEEGAECRIDEADLEDLSIIMEADVFAYLQSIKEYKHILRHHGVQVVHVTSEGVTTIYLQSDVPSGSEVKQNMRQAHKELRQLYQKQEGCLRKDQIQKSALYMPDGLSVALKNVQLVLPNVLFSYDQDNIYIVGEKSEVSQAKQMLLLGVERSMMASLTEMPPSSSSSAPASPESLEKEQQVKRKSEVHTPVPPKLFGSSTERKGEAGNTMGKEYKLAARFKSSGLGLGREEIGGDLRSLTAKMDMLMLDLNSKSAPPTKSSLGTAGILGNDLTGEGTETFRMTSPSCTGEDVLFKKQEPLSMNTFGGTTFSTSKAKPTTPAGHTSTFATGVNASVNSASNTEVKTAAPSSSVLTSKSSLRRSNSFSGRPYLRDQVQNNQITIEPMIKAHAHQRARSNSISSGRTSKDCPITTVEAELTVSSLMWAYMKEAYCNQMDSMKSDLQMSEKQASKGEMSVTLKGTDSSKVDESHRQLQNLVAVVASDFCTQEDTSQEVLSNSSRKSRGKSTKQNSATLEKLESPSSMMDELSKTNSLSQLANARENTSGPKIDGPTSLPLEAHKKQDNAMTLKQTNLLSHTSSEQCVCGAISTNMKRTTCGVILCCDCLSLHSYCRVCGKEGVYSQKKVLGDPVQSYGSKDIRQDYQAQEQHSEQEDTNGHKGIQGTMTCAEMTLGLLGYTKYTTAKITYCIPDGIQGDKDPCPGSPFKGGIFEAYLPLDPKGRSLLPYLKKAFNQGLTFTISSSKKACGGDAKVNWGKIPHKTRMEGGKSGNGYPDSTYLIVLSNALVAHGIKEAAAISQDQAKS
ncbi:uncharacterized protein si:busm1-163l24.3 isoform X2 [Chanodichthys erythropterus]|uniref:uncharacterized protein si:busm1-163l24.3 isoform X2 n=1 Tax=Chanodichthys erythropterus TaxID=933992 RepID=UPI00351EB3AB